MADYRRFDKSDWYGFAGAERFSNGSEPFIYSKLMNDGLVELTIIADRTGIEIFMYGDGDDNPDVWDKEIPNLSSLRAEGEMKKLIEYVKKFEYAPDLSYELDHPSNTVVEGFEWC